MVEEFPAAISHIRERIETIPDLVIVLGSGFQSVLETVEAEIRIPLAELPGCVAPSVPGHEAAAILGATLGGAPVLLISGRLHFYEGHTMERITLPLRVLAAAGAKRVLLTNAAGGIRSDLDVGDLLCVKDHINFTGVNPLRGPLGVAGRGFVDLTDLYSARMNQLLGRSAKEQGFAVHHGVYLGVSGPSFETPAEIDLFERWGGDVVGMSTIPEAIAAKQAGMEVAALSFITNLAAGRSKESIRHEDVLAQLRSAGDRLGAVIQSFCRADTENALST